MRTARKYIVHGAVQGVGYRFFTCTCAEALGVTGWVRNMPEGTVEVFAEGNEDQLKEFEFDLSRGARYARVSHLEQAEVPVEGLAEFKMRR